MTASNAMNAPPFSRIAILGLGLMGGSLAKALLLTEQAVEIQTFDPSGAALEGTLTCHSPQAAVENAELILLASPLSAFEALLSAIGDSLSPDALVMDLGSVKAGIGPLMARHLGHRLDLSWVGGHPMCGSEKSGAAHASGSLYQNACFFLTEGHWTGDRQRATQKCKQLERFIHSLGAKPCWTDPEIHDQRVAQTSHLPHLSAAALVHCLAGPPEDKQAFIAGGFKDMTRIAGGDEIVWRDILLANQAAVLTALSDYEKQLGQIRKLLETADGPGLEWFLKTAKASRNQYLQIENQI